MLDDRNPPDDRIPASAEEETSPPHRPSDPAEKETEEEGADPQRGESAEKAPAAPAEPVPGEDEIVLTEGKTLSDYLKEEAPSSTAAKEVDYRSVSNVERMVVPPPAGIRLKGDQREQAASADREQDAGGTPAATVTPAGDPSGLAASPASAAPSGPPQAGARNEASRAEEEGSFGEMLEASMQAKTFSEGERVKGVVVAIGPEVAFLDIGAKSEAAIEIGELKDHEGDIEVEVGDTIEALVVSTEGGLKLSRKLVRGAAAVEQLGGAHRAGLPVEGRVEKAIKGGYEVRVAGQRAFCPISQISLARTADPSEHAGKVYTFRIIEFKDGGKNIVLSRRAIQQEEERARAEEARRQIVPGAILTGRVASVREYGAFIDLGGVQGLLHVSEMGWGRVTNPSEVVKAGDDLTVKVLRVDEEKGKISLGLKQLQADPWSTLGEKYAVGRVVPGRIVRLTDFGAFVQLEPGIEALAHVSTFPPTGTPDGWKKGAPAGSSGQFEVLSVDQERKRIGVAMLAEGSSRAFAADRGEPSAAAPSAAAPKDRPARPDRPAIVPGAKLKGKIDRHEKFGVFVFLAPGKTGLMAAAESGHPRGADLRKAFPIGSEVDVAVLEVDPTGKRIRLSRRALLEEEEKDTAREFSERRQPREAFGSIGDKLRAALESKRK